jgi:hypothetical protein
MDSVTKALEGCTKINAMVAAAAANEKLVAYEAARPQRPF